MQSVNQDVENRDQFGSKWGFILAAAGSAVGLGNLWRFPKEVGSNGGGAFVLLYLFFYYHFRFQHGSSRVYYR